MFRFLVQYKSFSAFISKKKKQNVSTPSRLHRLHLILWNGECSEFKKVQWHQWHYFFIARSFVCCTKWTTLMRWNFKSRAFCLPLGMKEKMRQLRYGILIEIRLQFHLCFYIFRCKHSFLISLFRSVRNAAAVLAAVCSRGTICLNFYAVPVLL